MSSAGAAKRYARNLKQSTVLYLGYLPFIVGSIHASPRQLLASGATALVRADAPREVVENDTVDLGGSNDSVYAYTAIDIFSKEPSIYIAANLEMATGAMAFAHHHAFYGEVKLYQSDNGSEFQTDFKEAVLATGGEHRYSRPYKKNEQSHIENFNKALRNECFPGSHYSQQDIPVLQEQANNFVQHYIHRRWHMGLPDLMTPVQFKQYYDNNPEVAKMELAKVYTVSHLVWNFTGIENIIRIR